MADVSYEPSPTESSRTRESTLQCVWEYHNRRPETVDPCIVSQHVTTQTDRVETKAESEYAVRHLTVPRWRLIRVPGCKQQPPLLASEYQCEPQTTAVRRQSMRVKQPQTTAVRRQTMRVKQPQTTIVRRQSMRVKQLQTTAVRERSVRVKPQPSTSVDDRCG